MIRIRVQPAYPGSRGCRFARGICTMHAVLHSFFELLRFQTFNKKSFDSIFGIPLFILLQADRCDQVLMGPEPCLCFVVQVALGCNMCEQMGNIRESGRLWADGAYKRNISDRPDPVVSVHGLLNRMLAIGDDGARDAYRVPGEHLPTNDIIRATSKKQNKQFGCQGRKRATVMPNRMKLQESSASNSMEPART